MSVFKERISSKNLEGQLIDTHTHSGGMDLSNFFNGRYPSNQDILDLNEKRIRNGVGFQIVYPMQTSIYYDITTYWKLREFLPSGYSEYPFQLENRYLLLQIRYFSLERMLPFVGFSLQDKVIEQESDILRLAKDYSIYGLKYHTKIDQKSADKVDKESDFVEIAKHLNIPITFHTEQKGVSSAISVLELASRYPEVRFCAAHFGGFSADFFRELDKYPYDNLYFDTCPLLPRCHYLSNNRSSELLDLDYENPRSILKYFAEHYPDRVLWGTDSPWTNYGPLDEYHKNLSEFGYCQEVEIIKTSGYHEMMTQNTIRYLFGGE
ncbi:MAG: amidohydrolase family protein [Lachnospiraceae bacterium]|nr:amidohydrolase family protein [Lachnospiraceae bacterium]